MSDRISVFNSNPPSGKVSPIPNVTTQTNIEVKKEEKGKEPLQKRETPTLSQLLGKDKEADHQKKKVDIQKVKQQVMRTSSKRMGKFITAQL